MSRPMKKRKICSLPESTRFGPLDLGGGQREPVKMTVDGYEAIRLIDLEGMTQEECARRMNVARTTVQGIYIRARRQLAESLVNGRELLIEGAAGFATVSKRLAAPAVIVAVVGIGVAGA